MGDFTFHSCRNSGAVVQLQTKCVEYNMYISKKKNSLSEKLLPQALHMAPILGKEEFLHMPTIVNQEIYAYCLVMW